jgi:hypothetical protein
MANGADVADRILAQALGNPEVIRLLEHLLADARAGRVIGLGVGVALAPGQFNGFAVGAGLGEINLGLDAAKAVLLRASQGGNILRPRP